MTSRATVARHATWTALAAVSLDAAYTLVYWLILGRDERRKGPHPELRYFLILGQLGVETAAIIHLVGQLRRVQS